MPTKIPGIKIPDSVLRFAPDYDSYCVVSDIDRTYLATDIHSLRGLLRAAFEGAEEKKNIPGFSIVLRALRHGCANKSLKRPLFFLSASPPQMEKKLRAKMSLDGIEHEGVILKDQLAHIKKAKFKKLREQIGYKLGALLSLRESLPVKTKFIFFGDDGESDALIFTLFQAVSAGHFAGLELYRLLRSLGVFRREALQVAWFSRNIRCSQDSVAACFLNLDSNTRASFYSDISDSLFACEDSLQMILALYQQGLVRKIAVMSVIKSLIYKHDFSSKRVISSFHLAVKKSFISLDLVCEVWKSAFNKQMLPQLYSDQAFEDWKPVSLFGQKQWGAVLKKRSAKDFKKLFDFSNKA